MLAEVAADCLWLLRHKISRLNGLRVIISITIVIYDTLGSVPCACVLVSPLYYKPFMYICLSIAVYVYLWEVMAEIAADWLWLSRHKIGRLDGLQVIITITIVFYNIYVYIYICIYIYIYIYIYMLCVCVYGLWVIITIAIVIYNIYMHK